MLTGSRQARPLRGIFAALAAAAALSLPVHGGVHVQVLDREAGLPSTQVHAVAQAADGVMWFAGPSGLARYDGGGIVSVAKRAGLSSQGLRALAVDRGGRLWIGTDVGVDLRLDDGTIDPLVPPESWSYGFVEAFAEDQDGGMWIATSRGLLLWTDLGGLAPAAAAPLRDGLVTSVTVTGSGVWAAGPVIGVWRFDHGSWRPAREKDWSIVGSPVVVAPAYDGFGVLLGGERGLCELDGEGRRVRSYPGQAERRVSAILATQDGAWVGIAGQLRRLRADGRRFRDRDTVLPSALINDLLLDRQGNVWIATDNAGVGKVSALRRAIRQADAPCETQVYSLYPSRRGELLVGGDTCSWRAAAETLAPRRKIRGLDRIKVWDLQETGDGRLIAATQQGLFVENADGVLVRHPGESAVLRAPGRVLLQAAHGIWIGTQTGLALIDAESVREAAAPHGASLGYVYTLVRDPEGRVWIGTIGNGLWRLDERGAPRRVERTGLDPRGNVYSLDFLSDGRAVIAHDDRLVLLSESDLREIPTAMGDAVAGWSVHVDDRDRVWVGGTSGLVRYDPDTGQVVQRVTRSMGLGGNEFTTSRSLWSDASGVLHCGLEAGLSTVDPAALEEFTEPPVPRLFGLRWNRARVSRDDAGYRVRHGNWTVDVHAFAPWFVDEQSLRYQHRLRGFDVDWSVAQAASATRIHYTGLPAGRYSLEVRAHSPLVGWGPAARVLEFQVLPPWWRHPAVLAAQAALLAALVGLAWSWRNRALRRRTRRLERRVAERTAELTAAMRKLEQLATSDPLTGLPNQRTFWERARELAGRTDRNPEIGLALVLIDLDHFKRINDTHGHSVGDDVLVFAARRLASRVRGAEFLGRYGGEEFVALLSPAGEEQARQAAERMRHHLSAEPFRTEDGQQLTITASFGVAQWKPEDDTVEHLFRRADEAMYVAKRTRDRVSCWSERRRPDLPAASA